MGGSLKICTGIGVLEFAKRGWRAEVAVAACTVASESKRVTSPDVFSHDLKTHLIMVDKPRQRVAYNKIL